MKGKKCKKFLVALLVLSMVVCGMPGAGDTYVKAEEKGTEAKEGNREFKGPGYQLSISVSSEWDGGYVAEAVVTNTGKKAVRNWSVIASGDIGKIVRSWNVTDRKSASDETVFESGSSNFVIQPGEKASFGFQVAGGSCRDIISLRLVQGKVTAIDKAAVVFRETGSWDGHKTIEGVITNNSGKPMRDWSLSFELNGEITNIWNVAVVHNEGNCFCVESCDYNAVIEAGQSVTFGFEVAYGTASFQGIQKAAVYASSGGNTEPTGQPLETKEPEETGSPLPAFTPVVTSRPAATDTPDATPSAAPSGAGESEEDGSEDDVEFVRVENRDWNMDMIRANDSEVVKAKKAAGRKIRVTMLDSGINFSSEVDVEERKNFVEGEDEMSYLFEDGSGHGTAIAEVLASNPEKVRKEENGDVDIDDEFGEYTYYGDEEDDSEAFIEDEGNTETVPEGTVSLGELLESGYEWTEGINPNIELYSGKILDQDNNTTVDRAVKGIEWAIENDTDILSLSIGMDKDSERLHKAIQKAAAKGMLIIAAVGDDEEVDYPAAYPEVMAVGMADSMGKTAGVPSEVVAPGKSIVSRGVFDSMQLFTGSSMAVPHVVGLASILWQRDSSKTAAFIRGLIDVSANPVEGDSSCQYGLIDCRYALDSYDTFEERAREDDSILNDIMHAHNEDKVKDEVAGEISNEAEVETESEMEGLHGNWSKKQHMQFVTDVYSERGNRELGIRLDALKAGISFVDREKSGCAYMHINPWFHGFFGTGSKEVDGKQIKTLPTNYMTSFRTLFDMAEGIYRNGKVTKPVVDEKDPEEVQNAVRGIRDAFDVGKGTIGEMKWKEISSGCNKENKKEKKTECRSLVVCGMAMHTLSDTFAHSSFGMKKGKGEKKDKIVWKRLTHKKNMDSVWKADNKNARKLRYEAAKAVTHKVLRWLAIDKESGEFRGYSGKPKANLKAYLATDQFEKLKKYSVNFGKKFKEGREIKKLAYFKQGFALGNFSRYYEQEVGRGYEDKDSQKVLKLENYMKYVDKDEVKKEADGLFLAKVSAEMAKRILNQSSKVKLRAGGETLMTLKPTGEYMAFVLYKDVDYEIVITEGGKTNTLYTFKNGVMYDSIGRKLKLQDGKDEDEDEDEADDGWKETEDQVMCDLADYEPSTDCLVKGKVVGFEFSPNVSVGTESGLEGVKITAVSRKTGKIYEKKTKKDGSYKLQLPPGEYDITYEKDNGYGSARQHLTAGGDLYQNITVELLGEEWFGEGYLDGFLYDKETGRPLGGASVKIYEGIGYSEGDSADSTQTDGTGYFTTDYLEGGAYTFVISKEGYKTKYYYEPVIGGVASRVPRLELEREEE